MRTFCGIDRPWRCPPPHQPSADRVPVAARDHSASDRHRTVLRVVNSLARGRPVTLHNAPSPSATTAVSGEMELTLCPPTLRCHSPRKRLESGEPGTPWHFRGLPDRPLFELVKNSAFPLARAALLRPSRVYPGLPAVPASAMAAALQKNGPNENERSRQRRFRSDGHRVGRGNQRPARQCLASFNASRP